MRRKGLEAAILAGDLEKVRQQIAAGADTSAAFESGVTPIQLAARQRQTTIVRALAAAGADLDDLEALNPNERMTLYLDASTSREEDDDLLSPDLLSEWAFVAASEHVDEHFVSAVKSTEGTLLRAARLRQMDVLREGIEAGEDLNQSSPLTQDTPLSIAVQNRDEAMVAALIQAGADVNASGFSSPLTWALPNLHLVKRLLEAGADPHHHGLDGQTPLDKAVSQAATPESAGETLLGVRFLLEAGADPALSDDSSGELLDVAEAYEAWEVYHELLHHYPPELAVQSFEEVRSSMRRQEEEGGYKNWAFEVGFSAGHDRLDDLRELLAVSWDRETGQDLGLALRKAVEAMDLKAARLLLEHEPDLNVAVGYESRRGSTPLACAAEGWHRQSADVMALLLENGADVNFPGYSERTPLYYAVRLAYRHGAAVRKSIPILLEAGADPNIGDLQGWTPWMLAKAALIEAEEREGLGEAGQLELPEPLFDSPDIAQLFSENALKTDRREGPLKRCQKALKLLEAAGAQPQREVDIRLLVAAALGATERVRELLDEGADPDMHNPDGFSAVEAAARLGSLETVELLAKACPDGEKLRNLCQALSHAVGNLDKDMTRFLLDAGADATYVIGSFANRALAKAEEAGAHELVQMLRDKAPPTLAYMDRDVREEIEADDRAWESQNDLAREASFGNVAKVHELLEIPGVEADVVDVLGRTALMAAAEAGQEAMVRELIALGADVNRCVDVTASPRSTPLVCAAIGPSANRDQVLKLLLEAGADPNRLGADGRTALMHAVERDVGLCGRVGDFALSTLTLLATDPDLEIRDPYGLTAWMRAMSLASTVELEEPARQYEEVAKILEKAGASTDGMREVNLIWAIMAHEVDEVRKLLVAGADPDARRFDGATALMLALRENQREMAHLLLDAGCDPDARQWINRGLTAMEAAEKSTDLRLARMINNAREEQSSA